MESSNPARIFDSREKWKKPMSMQAKIESLCREDAEFKHLFESIQNANSPHRELPRVAVCGLLKAGKSSLLNALTSSVEKELFATAATRATVATQEHEFDGITFIDTPGIDATEADDEEAWRGIVSADYLVFVHNLRSAVLDTSEVEFLKALLSRRSDVAAHMAIVLTHVESVEDSGSYRVDSIVGQISKILDEDCLPVFTTSFSRFKKGFQENKKLLISSSGIPEVANFIANTMEKDSYKSLQVRAAVNEEIRNSLSKKIRSYIDLNRAEISKIRASQDADFNAMKDEFQRIVSYLKDRISQYESI